jgi:hypothetical protein
MPRICRFISFLILVLGLLSNCIQASQITLGPTGAAAAKLHATIQSKSASSEVLFNDDEANDTDISAVASNYTVPIYSVHALIPSGPPLATICPPERPTVLRI